MTVEASSPALIEKTRSVVTDGSGQYKIVDLRPGTYSVSFMLTGFNTSKRDGIELTGSFVATVNADMKVGGLEETVTVSGESPIVDVQSITQERVLGKDVIDAIPTSNTHFSVATLIPAVQSSNTADVGDECHLARRLDGSRGPRRRYARIARRTVDQQHRGRRSV